MAEPGAEPVVLDFGMHEGEDTDFFLTIGAKVIAFEANPQLVAHNSRRFADALGSGRLEIVAGAIVPPDFTGTEQTFYVDRGKSIWGTTDPHWVQRNRTLGSDITAVTVPAINLRGILAHQPNLLYAKIDIEGADRFVLDTLRSIPCKPEFVSIESDKLDLTAVIAEIETLQALGYSRFAAVQQATVPGSITRDRGLNGAPFEHRFAKHASGPFGPFLKQPYKPAGAVIDDYRAIFRAYARYGDRSPLMRLAPLRLATRAVNHALVKTIKRPLCGWYDTHAAR